MITQNFDKIIRDFLTYYKVEVKDLNFSFNNAVRMHSYIQKIIL